MSKSRGLLLSVIGTLIALALIGTAAIFAYRIGLNQGMLAGENINFEELPSAAPYLFHQPLAHPHSGIGGLLIGLVFLFIIVGFVKKMLFFSWYGASRRYGPKSFKHWHPHWGAWYMDDDEDEDESPGEGKKAA